MCQHFFHPHLTLGKPIFHPGHSSFQIQTGTYFTPVEKTGFTKIGPCRFQTNIQYEYHRKNPRASSPGWHIHFKSHSPSACPEYSCSSGRTKPLFCHITHGLFDLHWRPVRHRISFKIATVTFRVLQIPQPSYLASHIPKYVPARALRSSSALSVCVLHVEPSSQPPDHFHLLLQISGTHCQIICLPFQLLLLLKELSNITYCCLFALTLVRNLVRSNRLNVSRFVIHRQLLPLHSPEIACRPWYFWAVRE